MNYKIFLSMCLATALCSCTNTDYKKEFTNIIDEISAPQYYGRSDYANGDINAAKYIIDYISDIEGITPMASELTSPTPAYPPYKSPVIPGSEGRWNNIDSADKYLPYLQHFQIPMNVMRGEMAVSIDGKALRPTFDFTAKEFSPSCHGTYPVQYVPDSIVAPEHFIDYINSGKLAGKFAVINMAKYCSLPAHPFERYKPYLCPIDSTKVGGIILKSDELIPYFKARSYFTTPVPVIGVDNSFPEDAQNITINIDAEFLPNHDCHNIIAYLPGTEMGNDVITLIAHYDHLGLMGRDNIFYGSNDNASGTAMLCVLAKYFSTHRPKCNLQFIWLDAEEANLLGAFYYCQNPTIPLGNVKLVLNLDMVADDGDHLATECSDNGMSELEIIKQINNNNGDHKPFDISLQELTDNSDHYAFDQAGVPSIYFSTEGNYLKDYHSPRDCNSNYSADNFDRLFSLITSYINKK